MPHELVISYQSPPDDPLKLPRPHYYDPEAKTLRGGEAGTDIELVGLSRQSEDLTFFPSDWVDADQIDGSNYDVYEGWFLNYRDRDGGTFTFLAPIASVREFPEDEPGKVIR